MPGDDTRRPRGGAAEQALQKWRSATPAPSARRFQRDPSLRTELAIHQGPAPQEDRAREVPDDLHLHPHLVADAHVGEHPEIVDRGEVAARRRIPTVRRPPRTPTLRERLEDDRRRENAVAADAGIGGAHELREGGTPLSDLEHAVEEQKG